LTRMREARRAGRGLLNIWEGVTPPAPFGYFAERAVEFQGCLSRLSRREADSLEGELASAMGVTADWLRGLAIVGCRANEAPTSFFLLYSKLRRI